VAYGSSFVSIRLSIPQGSKLGRGNVSLRYSDEENGEPRTLEHPQYKESQQYTEKGFRGAVPLKYQNPFSLG
jgi:hypothetical protein